MKNIKKFIKILYKKDLKKNKYFFITFLVFISLLFNTNIVNSNNDQKYLGNYYIDCTNIAKNWSGPFDKDGIPLTDYKEFGIQYQPVGIAQYALGTWGLYLKNKDLQYKEKFIRMADWFCDNLVIKDNFGVWEYQFDFPRYNLKAPWPSAMSQGEGISVLMRAYQLTENKKYIETAKLVLNSFKVPIEMGGVLYKDKEGFVWYEEYPSLENEPPHVLNGFFFALFGIYDYYKATENEEALELFNQGIKTLKEKINLWDLGFWSRYDLTDIYGENIYLFRFVTDKKHPKFSHPVDKVVFNILKNNTDIHQIVLDIGDKEDITDVFKNGSHLFYDQEYQDWGETYFLDGRSVRNYENCSGKWAHAPFEFFINFQPFTKYFIDIIYKDVSTEPIFLEIYADGRKYIRFGKLDNIDDKQWKTIEIEIPSDLLRFIKGTGFNYHSLHIQQLSKLYEITGEDVFKQYAIFFDNYYKAVNANLWWKDLKSNINDLMEINR